MPTCIPLAEGPPGPLFQQAPQWWDKNAQNYLKDLDDPRWRGAVARGYNSGTGVEAKFRGVQRPDASNKLHLYLSFQVYADANPDQQADRVYVGFQREAGAPAYILQVNSPSSTGPTPEADPPWLHEAMTTNGTEWSTIPEAGGPLTGVPGTDKPDIKGGHWLRDKTEYSNAYLWAINLRIPVTSSGANLSTAGINLGNLAGGGTFRFWYALWVAAGEKDPNDPSGGTYITIPYYWPRVARITSVGATRRFPATGTWDTASIGSGGDCGTGISLDSNDIGTTNNPPTYIKANLNRNETNHFVIRPKNNRITAGVLIGAVEAEARIANWGSQTQQGYQTAAGATAWEVIPFNAPAGGWGWNNATAILDGQPLSGAIEFDWVIDPTTAGLFVGPGAPRNRHQCILVTLKNRATSPPNPGYDFINDSAYNNMEFLQTRSPVRRSAELNVKGRERIDGGAGGTGARKLYVFVERTNMPPRLRPADEVPRFKIERTDDEIEPTDDESGDPSTAFPRAYVSVDYDTLAQQGPTIRYHVFHPTETVVRDDDGRMVRIFEPQTSFGYFVAHDAELHGWEHELVAGSPSFGAVAPPQPTKLGGDQFAVEVPHEGAVVVDTVISPIEQPIPEEPWWLRLIRWLIRLIRRLFRR